MIAPKVVTWLSTSRSGRSAPSSRKRRLPLPRDERIDHHPELVDEVVLDQRLHELGAAYHVKVLAVLLLQRGHGLGDITTEDRRVLPLQRLGERPRRHVLRQRVQRLGDDLLLLGGGRPVSREDLVGATWSAWWVSREEARPGWHEIVDDQLPIDHLRGEWPVDELAETSVTIVGVGSIGSAVADALSGYAVGKLALVDPDRLLQHNLVRHRARAEDLGRYKVNATAEWLRMRNPQLKVTTYPLDVIDEADPNAPALCPTARSSSEGDEGSGEAEDDSCPRVQCVEVTKLRVPRPPDLLQVDLIGRRA
jgi:hypothetical protein